jgi:hypothetical protein
MATPSEKHVSLDAPSALQEKGFIAIKSETISRTHHQRLIDNAFLRAMTGTWDVLARMGALRAAQ